MRKYALVILGLVVFVLAGWLLKTNKESEQLENKSFIQKIDHLVLTRHGKCRMLCREITEAEVREIILNGTINYAKSDPADRPCATYAIEGYSTTDQQHIRVVVADCEQSLKLVTCIDLEKDHSCSCK